MSHSSRTLLIATMALLLLPSCGILDTQSATNITTVELSSNNFVVRDTNLEGVDTGWGLFFSGLGLSFTRSSVNDAMNDLMDQVDASNHAVGLINVTRSIEVSNWILFHVVQKRVRADVVEFID